MDELTKAIPAETEESPAAETAIVKTGELAPDVFAVDEKLAAFEGVTPDLPIIKHNYLGRLFSLGEDHLQEITAMLVRFRGGVRRNYESDYNPSDPEPPTCYSSDGVQGARAEEMKTFKIGEQTVTHRVYGMCASCWYSKFGTAGAWKGQVRKGVQCSEYALAFIILDSGMPAVLQVPPTSVRNLRQDLTTQVGRIAGASLNNQIWKFLPTGGGKRKDAITVVSMGKAPLEKVQAIQRLAPQFDVWIADFVDRFVSGGAVETESINNMEGDAI